MPQAPLDCADEDHFWAGARAAERFFMGQSEVQKALTKLVENLDRDRIPYAVIGAMALNEFGYQRTTVDVDVLLTAEGLSAFKARHLGRGYVEKFSGSRGLRDTEHGVDIDVVLAGSYPGDGKPKPVAFPDPATAAQRGTRIALLPLAVFVELKLASGLTAPDRLKDLADVQEIIRLRQLPRTLANELNPFVRDKYLELWDAVEERRNA
ncbi:MAG TPA: hypothetical protein VN085_09515 [Vicinamibacterales bacterium]|jgi:hypothetical protein|nr:hypothetical protein [Vicinamibacterales bacterium]